MPIDEIDCKGGAMAEKEEKSGSTLNIHLSKEIDAALGDVIRGLLKRPAEEAGHLIADGIGILGDRVRRKREINAQLGMEEVRKKLEADGVDMKNITPPEEEELHLLINGMSLAGDETVRNMWAGLFAKALEPNSGVTANRSFLSVLDSLSPTDAKIIHFLAHATLQLEKLAPSERWGVPIFADQASPELKERRNAVIAEIEAMARDYTLAPPKGKNWSDNLMRQGIIEIPPKSQSYWHGATIFESGEVDRALQELTDKIRELEHAAEYRSAKPEALYYVVDYGVIGGQFNFRVQLSSFGRSLAEACGLL